MESTTGLLLRPFRSPFREVDADEVDRETEAGADKTLDRYIVDYLLRTGRMKAATALTEKRGIEVSLPALDVFIADFGDRIWWIPSYSPSSFGSRTL